MTVGNEPKEVQKEYLKIASSYSIPIFWTDSKKVVSNGSAFILNTGQNIFVVTAAHVYDNYIKAKTEGRISSCQLSNIEFELEKRRISNNDSKSMDIATFVISDDEIKSLGKNILHGSQSVWPPAQPNEGEVVVVAGYPGLERLEEKDHECSFGLYCFNTPVSSVSGRHFGCSFERKYWVDLFGNGLPEEFYNLGGISGAPVLALEKSSESIVSWRLAGVVYEAKASEVLGEILLVHHAKYINSDGTVRDYT